MNKKRFASILCIILVILLAGIAGYFALLKKPSQQHTPPTNQPATSVEYKNIQYGFSFTLPLSWQGYSIVTNSWQGTNPDDQNAAKDVGPEILIRHPLWTSANPRQDIPIMIFTLAQWDLVQQEKLSLGAAPIGPSELGRNSTYVFALPARYNFAFLTGYEEVDTIIQSNPLNTVFAIPTN